MSNIGPLPSTNGEKMSQATAERRKQIMSQLLARKQVTVKELAAAMEVSDATVRRDLKALADAEGLRLVHGGATLPRERDFSFQARQLRATEEKKVIGALASTLLHEGEHVFLGHAIVHVERQQVRVGLVDVAIADQVAEPRRPLDRERHVVDVDVLVVEVVVGLGEQGRAIVDPPNGQGARGKSSGTKQGGVSGLPISYYFAFTSP